MKVLLSLLCLLFSFVARAQTDVIAAKNGEITIAPILHSSLVLQWKNKTIYVDPYGGSALYTRYGAPDLVLITDIHGDHLNPETLQGLDLSGAELVAPQAVIDQLGDIQFKKKRALANGEELNWQSLRIMAMPMYNLPPSEEARHVKGRGNGYVITFGDKRLYLAGDTEAIPEMRQLKNIDVAFIPMNLPYTMDVQQAAEGVLDFKPKIVYPYHYRGAENSFSDVEEFKRLVEAGDSAIEVRLREWYPETKKAD